MCKEMNKKINVLTPYANIGNAIVVSGKSMVCECTPTPESLKRSVAEEKFYDSLDKAAMAAAIEIYSASEARCWKCEHGIALYEKGGKYYISEKIAGGENGVKFGNAIEDKQPYSFRATVHSHPTDPPYIFANEFSAHDYYESLKGHNNTPFPIYLVVNVGEGGTIIKFTPIVEKTIPTKKKEVIRNIIDHRKKIPITTWEALFEEHKVKIDNEVVVKMSRLTKIDLVKTMLNGDKCLVKAPISKKFIPEGREIPWEALSLQTILWKSSATSLIISIDRNKEFEALSTVIREYCALGKKTKENSTQWDILWAQQKRYFEKLTYSVLVNEKGPKNASDAKKQYDLRDTIKEVIISDDIGVINNDHAVIPYDKIRGAINVLRTSTANLRLYVPEKCCNIYKNASDWNVFKDEKIFPLKDWGK